jgi:hypothetical protein
MCDSGVGGLGTDAQTFCPSTLGEASDPADCVETFTISAVHAYRLALALLALCAVVAVVGPVLEARRRAPEQTVRAYLAAVERQDLEGALETLASEAREPERDQVELQLGSRYAILVLALGAPSIADRALGASPDAAHATVLAEVTPVSGERWRSTTVVRMVSRDGVWYLLSAPFA